MLVLFVDVQHSVREIPHLLLRWEGVLGHAVCRVQVEIQTTDPQASQDCFLLHTWVIPAVVGLFTSPLSYLISHFPGVRTDIATHKVHVIIANALHQAYRSSKESRY